MSASYDVFLNYDPTDDRAVAGETIGWVSHVRRGLELRLSALLVRKPVIKTSADTDASPVGAAAIVCFVSPASLSSASFNTRLDEFAAATPADGNGSDRILSVMIAAVPRDHQPARLRDVRSYELLSPGSLGAAVGAHDEKKFWTIMDDLAHTVVDAIESTQRLPATPHGARIYLAETNPDLNDERNRIRRELQRHGHVVVPGAPLPDSADEAERIIRDELARCSLSINLIGAQYGTVPRGGTESIVAIQHRLALEQCHTNPNFHHVVWIPPDLVADDSQQQSLLTTLRQFMEVGQGTELVQTVLEDFKTLVEDKLRPAAPAKSSMPPERAKGSEPKVYLMYDRQDRETIVPLQEYAQKRGVQLIPSVFEGEQSTLREIHQQNLRTCDAALIIYGNVREPWVRMKQQDLLKAAGFGRSTKMLAKAIYVCPEETEPKKRFNAQEVMVIKDFNGIVPSSLQPFLDQVLASTKGGAAV